MEYYEQEEKQEGTFRSKYLIGVLAVLAVILIVSAGVLLFFGVRQSRYDSAIKKANQCYTSGDYQGAIAAYEDAIALNDKKENAYINLVSVYMNIGEYGMALEVVERGMSLIDSEKLSEKKVVIHNLLGSTLETEESLTTEQIALVSAEVSLENSVFDRAADYTYTDYYRDFGNVSAVRGSGNVVFDYTAGGFSVTYYDLSEQKLLDAQSGMPFATVKPAEISFHSLYDVFAISSDTFAVSYEKLQELFGSTLAFCNDTQSGMYYITAEYKNCRISIETDAQGNIISETAWNKLEPLYRSVFEAEAEAEGEVKGYIQDATTGKGMRATLKVRSKGKKSGTVIEEIYSKSDGSYVFGGEEGGYTIEVSAKGYITEYMDVEIIKDQVKTGMNAVLSPEVGEGEIRIVLTWGSNPRDLDSYAVGTSSTGRSFSISYSNKSVTDVGNLDVDDVNGYGPETITITDTGASFEYSVVDYLREGMMGGSEATVKVYLPGKTSAMEFKVPAGEGLTWTVFKYEKGEIKTINRIN